MYEISSCYDRGFLIDEIMLYLIMYELFHDPYLLGLKNIQTADKKKRFHSKQIMMEKIEGKAFKALPQLSLLVYTKMVACIKLK